MNRLPRYTIVTPIKNEIANVPNLVACIANQSIQPCLWVFVDDWSNDGSFESLEEWAAKYHWIKVIRTDKERKREIAFHYADVVKIGFDYLKRINQEYDYTGVLDADVLLEKDYFEKLMKNFQDDQLLGVGSGIIMSRVGSRRIWEKEPPEWPCGAARLWSRECFEKTGWKVTRAPDSVSTVKAMVLGYRTSHFVDLVITHLRPTWSSCGYWRGFTDLGNTRYYLGYEPFFVILASLKYTYDYPHIGTVPFLLGYFCDFFSYKKRIEDKDIIDFFKWRLINKFRAWFRRKWRECRQERID